MKLEIISPQSILFSGEVEIVTLPGVQGTFALKEKHAPLFSILKQGTISLKSNGEELNFDVKDGVVETNNNITTVCVSC